MKKLLLSCFILSICLLNNSIFAQKIETYNPLQQMKDVENEVLTKIENNYKDEVNNIPISFQYKDEVKDVYLERKDKLKKEINQNEFLFDSLLYPYLNNILQNILQNNSKIPQKNIHILVGRSQVPNAYCLGDGSIVFNIALLKYMENESQIAFIICHELAHYTLNHVDNAILERIGFLNSKETQKKLKKIKKSGYNKTKQAEELLRSYIYTDRRHTRLHEADADSMGLVYIKNTKYEYKEALRVLEILDKIDKESGNFDLIKVFDRKEYPFQEEWIREEKLLSIGGAKSNSSWEIDSLKTHPDCQKRINLLKPNINTKTINTLFLQGEILFQKVTFCSKFEVVESAYIYQNYGLCIYYTLQLLEKYPKNAYLHAMIVKCLFHIYQAQKNHEMNRYVDMPSDYFQQDYKQVLTFLNRIRLSDIAQLSYHYLKSYQEGLQQDEHFLFALILASELTEKKDEQVKWVQKYKSTFEQGIYWEYIDNN